MRGSKVTLELLVLVFWGIVACISFEKKTEKNLTEDFIFMFFNIEKVCSSSNIQQLLIKKKLILSLLFSFCTVHSLCQNVWNTLGLRLFSGYFAVLIIVVNNCIIWLYLIKPSLIYDTILLGGELIWNIGSALLNKTWVIYFDMFRLSDF